MSPLFVWPRQPGQTEQLLKVSVDMSENDHRRHYINVPRVKSSWWVTFECLSKKRTIVNTSIICKSFINPCMISISSPYPHTKACISGGPALFSVYSWFFVSDSFSHIIWYKKHCSYTIIEGCSFWCLLCQDSSLPLSFSAVESLIHKALSSRGKGSPRMSSISLRYPPKALRKKKKCTM